jgi:hypothetical protein
MTPPAPPAEACDVPRRPARRRNQQASAIPAGSDRQGHQRSHLRAGKRLYLNPVGDARCGGQHAGITLTGKGSAPAAGRAVPTPRLTCRPTKNASRACLRWSHVPGPVQQAGKPGRRPGWAAPDAEPLALHGEIAWRAGAEVTDHVLLHLRVELADHAQARELPRGDHLSLIGPGHLVGELGQAVMMI